MFQRRKCMNMLLERSYSSSRRSSTSLELAERPERFALIVRPPSSFTSNNSLSHSKLKVQPVSVEDSSKYAPKQIVRTREESRITVENQHTKLAEVLTPIWKVPYIKQLNLKFLSSVSFLRAVKVELKRKSVYLEGWKYNLPCELQSSLPVPKWRGYRNTDEFVVHLGVDNYTPTVGYCLGHQKDYKRRNIVCVEPSQLSVLKRQHKEIAKLFQDFVHESSLPVSKDLRRSYWRKLLVRSNHQNEIMISPTFHRQQLEQCDVDKEKQQFCQFFTEGPGKELNIKSLFFQTFDNETAVPPLHEHLWGDKHLVEVQGGLKLLVSPVTRILNNTAGSDVYFETVRRAANIKSNTTILDIGCGAGGLSLYLARKALRVIGAKLTAGSIADLYNSCTDNGISNTTFVQKRLINVLNQMKRSFSDDLVAVINPVDKILTSDEMFVLRSIPSLRRIILVIDKMDENAIDIFK